MLNLFDIKQPYLIAEVACAHQGDPNLLYELSEFALTSGFPAIKFQIMNARSHMSSKHKLFSLVESLEISPKIWISLFKHLRIKFPEAMLICDIYDLVSFDLVKSLKPDAIKIHAADLGNTDLIKKSITLSLPIYLGLGGSSYSEFSNTVSLIKANHKSHLCIMFGYQGFPTPLSNFGLKLIISFNVL